MKAYLTTTCFLLLAISLIAQKNVPSIYIDGNGIMRCSDPIKRHLSMGLIIHCLLHKYQQDTIFEVYRVSYVNDLSEMNAEERFFYSNNTNSIPLNSAKLKSIAGVGSSAVVQYEGTGAYFLDTLEEGVWRLVVMPDAIRLLGPFNKTFLKKEVVTTLWNSWNMEIILPDLGGEFTITSIDQNLQTDKTVYQNRFHIGPGVYLLKKKGHATKKNGMPDTKWKNIILGEFVAPKTVIKNLSVVYESAKIVEAEKSLQIIPEIIGLTTPDSVIIYTDKISFWTEDNHIIKMKRLYGYTYTTMVISSKNKYFTCPVGIEGLPLNWEYYLTEYWASEVVNSQSSVELVRITDEYSQIETYGIPESSSILTTLKGNGLKELKTLEYKVRDIYVNLKNARGINRMKVGFVTSDGYTYTSVFSINESIGLYTISLSELEQDETVLLPSPYPVFLKRIFIPEKKTI